MKNFSCEKGQLTFFVLCKNTTISISYRGEVKQYEQDSIRSGTG